MISKEDADKLKAGIKDKGFFGPVCDAVLSTVTQIIDKHTEPAPDPNREFVGTDRMMVFWDEGRDKNYGNLVNINITSISAPYSRKQGYHWQHCAPYLDDTTEMFRQLMAGKSLRNENGSTIRRIDGHLKIREELDNKWSHFTCDVMRLLEQYQWHVAEEKDDK